MADTVGPHDQPSPHFIPPPPPPLPPPPPPPEYGPRGPALGGWPARQPPAQVVHVVAKPGGLWRAVSIVGGLALFAAVFFLGMMIGIVAMVAQAGYENAVVRQTYRDGGSSTVAIIPVQGIIDGAQAEFVRGAADNVLNDRRVKAVVLRVDSPGGEVGASDQIWYEVKRLRSAGLTVVASYGGVAASGGYYVSCGADEIVAEATCITGSIGVIAQVLTFEGLLDKIGVTPVTLVATGSPEKSVANDIFRTWNEADKLTVRTMLDAAYETFHQRVSDGRARVITDPAGVSQLANGSIYTAAEALKHGLIDALGYLDDAISRAETRAGLTPGRSTVVMLRQPPSVLGDLFIQSRRSRASLDGEHVRRLVNDLSAPRIMYLMR